MAPLEEPLHADVRSAIAWVYEHTDNYVFESTDTVVRVDARGWVLLLRADNEGRHYWERMVRRP
jgi:hypothetical protein